MARITTIFDWPLNSDTPAEFSEKAADAGSKLNPFGAEVNDVAIYVNERADAAYWSAEAASNSALDAASRVTDVNAAAQGAFAAANMLGEWVSLTGAVTPPASVSHQGRLWYLRQPLANVASQEPGLGSAYWGDAGLNQWNPVTIGAGITVAVDGTFYRMAHPGAVLQLPANPKHTMRVGAVNVSPALTPYLDRNGKTIDGDAENYLLNLLGARIMLVYDANAGDWVAVDGITAFAPYREATLLEKVVTVVAPTAAGNVTMAPHGLARSKIRGVSITARGASYSAGPEYGTNDSLKYSAFIDDTKCGVSISSGMGSGIFGAPVYFHIKYEA